MRELKQNSVIKESGEEIVREAGLSSAVAWGFLRVCAVVTGA
jgi:hypothetical protein